MGALRAMVQRSFASWLVLMVAWCEVVSLVQSLPCQRPNVGGVQLAKVVCFITASSEHYDYESLRTGMCSHVVLIDLMGVGKDGSLELLQPSSRALNRFTGLRQRFRDVEDEAKFIVSIGGVAQKSSHFSKALKTPESRQALTDELISFNIKHALDGIDIAWFYPAQFGGAESDRTNLVVFLRDLYLRTKACAVSLSLTVGVDPKDIELSYDVPRINEVVDFVNLLTGDYHNPEVPTHISPLYGQGPRDRMNINYSVQAYIEAGLNPRKIVILNSCYGYLYVSKLTKNQTDCSTKLRSVLRLSFLSSREIIIRESFQTSWDDMRQVPYGTVTNGVTKKWITYSDAESVRLKAEYVLQYQLGGMGLFSVDEDDYDGRAGCGRYPILRTIVSVLYPQLACDELDEEEEGDEVESIVCPHDGYLADPILPEYYYVCEQGVALQACPKQRCPHGEIFNEVENGCCPQAYQYAVHSSPAFYAVDPLSQYSTIAPPDYKSPVASYVQPDPTHSVVGYVPPRYQQLAGQYANPMPGQSTYNVNPPSACIQSSPVGVASPPVSIDLSGSASEKAPTFYEPIQQPSNIVTKVVVNPNTPFNKQHRIGGFGSTMPPARSEEPPSRPPPNVGVPPVVNILDCPHDKEYIYTGAASTMMPIISEPAPQPAQTIPPVVITPNAKSNTDENAGMPSHPIPLAPQAIPLVQHAPNLPPSRVLISPNAEFGDATAQLVRGDDVLVVTPKPTPSEPTTPPVVMITSKVRQHERSSRKSSSARRKSRARSHSIRSATGGADVTEEKITAVPSTGAEAAAAGATASAAGPSSTGTSTIPATSTRDRSRARKARTTKTTSSVVATTTALSSAPISADPTTTTKTTDTTATSTTTTVTEPPTTTSATILTTTTATLAVPEPSTTGDPSTTADESMSSGYSSDSTLLPDVTFLDETMPLASSSSETLGGDPAATAPSSTWAPTTTLTAAGSSSSNTTSNATVPNDDTSSHLVTTIT